jgi:hypothetical protein
MGRTEYIKESLEWIVVGEEGVGWRCGKRRWWRVEERLEKC